MQWSACLSGTEFSGGPDKRLVFVLFELQCYCFFNVTLKTERLNIKSGLLASLDKCEVANAGPSLLHDSGSPSGKAHTLQLPTSLTSITCKAFDSNEFSKTGIKK